MALLADLTARHRPRAARAGPAPGRTAVPRRQPAAAEPARAASARSSELPYRPDAGDLDLDASLDAIVEAARRRARPSIPSACASAAGRNRAPRCACSSTAAARWAGKPLATSRGRRGRRRVAGAGRLQRARRSARTSWSPRARTARQAESSGRRRRAVAARLRHHRPRRRAAPSPASSWPASTPAARSIVLLSDCRATEPRRCVGRRRRARRAARSSPPRATPRRRSGWPTGRRHADDGQRPHRRRRRPVPRAVRGRSVSFPRGARCAAVAEADGPRSRPAHSQVTSRGGTMPMLFSSGPVAGAVGLRRRGRGLGRRRGAGLARRRGRRGRRRRGRLERPAPARRRATSRRGRWRRIACMFSPFDLRARARRCR